MIKQDWSGAAGGQWCKYIITGFSYSSVSRASGLRLSGVLDPSSTNENMWSK